ncbi:GumC family protein [Anaeromyxobacter oryzae]|uniref:non-specific protein-tyrosine kinase n=1 Tax=Anaeromyxobacter oryzae TaxID=2918170 RepID=A0ABM7WVK6_9BACT|nr:polysaccharide biosynthesis tyrosine autokinase [Anaeromyxobacter oryzae]BDG03446.1 protein-tyrosine kinase [Anaeromyxobacter oryzae]
MPPTADPQGPVLREEGDQLDLHAYWRVLLRRRWTVLAVFAAAVLLTLVVTLRQTRIYAGTATLIIELQAPKVLNNKDVQDVVETGTSSFWSSKEYFETQYRIITSRAVAQRVVEKLQLAQDQRFLGLDGMKDEAKLKDALQKVDPVETLQERLSVVPVKDSRVVHIIVEDRDPKWAATIANAVADAYIAESLSVRSTTTQSASDWLEQQLADLEAKLAQSADALFAFKQSHDIVSTTWEDRQTVVTQRIAAINDALTKTQVQRATLAARNELLAKTVEGLKEDPQADATVLSNQNMAIPELKVRYLDAKLECADVTSRYLENHPRVEACAAKMAAARQNLDREIQNTVGAARREYDETVEAERKLGQLLERAKAESFGLNQFEREYLSLKRTYDNNQRLYEMVLQRLKETGVTGMLQMSNVRVLDRAEPPEWPVRPRPVRNLALAVLLGLAGGVGFAFLLESLDTTITTREQIEERLRLPFLGIIPRIEKAADHSPELAVHSAPTSAAAECLRSIRTNLLFMSPEKPLRTILVTSSGPGEGKTTTAAALAATMANSGNRVLLVDADMRRPRVHKVFGVPTGSGLSSLILGDGSLDASIVRTDVPNLDVLPCGPVPPNPAELLHTANFATLVQEMSRRYDRVVIDSPPAGVVADAIVIATKVDGTLVVVKAGQTSRDVAARTVRSLADVKARLFGSVLNELDLQDRRYAQYYYYRSSYYREDEPGSSAKVA